MEGGSVQGRAALSWPRAEQSGQRSGPSLPALCNFQNPDSALPCPAPCLSEAQYLRLALALLPAPRTESEFLPAEEAKARWGAIQQHQDPEVFLASMGGDRGQAPSRPEGPCPQPGKGGQEGRVRAGFLCEEKEKAQEVSLEEVQVQMRGACRALLNLPP